MANVCMTRVSQRFTNQKRSMHMLIFISHAIFSNEATVIRDVIYEKALKGPIRNSGKRNTSSNFQDESSSLVFQFSALWIRNGIKKIILHNFIFTYFHAY